VNFRDDFRLEGKRLFLRRVQPTDVTEDYIRWMNDAEVNRFMETRFRHHSFEEISGYVKAMRDDERVLFMAILEKSEAKHIGNIKLGPISSEHGRGEISFWIGPKTMWGKGLATEAVLLVTDYALNVLGLDKVCAGCYSNHDGSRRVFEKAGFELECVMRRHYVWCGKAVDRLCFCKFRGSE
jgi:ribosomal-protein-alanine N-acetyltransferase